jgi:hypothetical protein
VNYYVVITEYALKVLDLKTDSDSHVAANCMFRLCPGSIATRTWESIAGCFQPGNWLYVNTVCGPLLHSNQSLPEIRVPILKGAPEE